MSGIGVLVWPLSRYVDDAWVEIERAINQQEADAVLRKYHDLITSTKDVTTSEMGEALDSLEAIRHAWKPPKIPPPKPQVSPWVVAGTIVIGLGIGTFFWWLFR